MKSGRTNATGQLRPLGERMSQHNQEKRAAKIEARKTVAQALAVGIGQSKLMTLAMSNAVGKRLRYIYIALGVEAAAIGYLIYKVL